MMHLTIHDDDIPDAAAIVGDGLDAANWEFVPIRDVRPLSVFVRDDAGTVVGGAVGRTWGACCELRNLWVAKPHRGQGLGSRLVRALEQRASERGCRLVYLETFSFQARPLYERLGYTTGLEITGFAEGVSKVIMTRVLSMQATTDR